MKNIRAYIVLLLIMVNAAGVAGCAVSVQAANLMDSVKPGNVSGKPIDSVFTESMADFSTELFKKSITDRKNSLVSPLSVTLALSMTANGAGGDKLVQMESLLGGDIPMAELNQYLYSFASGLDGIFVRFI